MKKIAVFPGSFDPFTIGHQDIANRAIPLFDQIIIAVGFNTSKKYMFDIETRTKWIKETYIDEPKIIVKSFNELTVDFCKKNNASFLLRGLRNSSDFEFEKAIGHANRNLDPNIEMVFLLTESSKSHISSSIVREIITFKGDYSKMVPAAVKI